MSIVLRSQVVAPSDFLWKVIANSNGKIPQYNWVALDPGETTGVCIWDAQTRKFTLEQWDTKDLGKSYDHLCWLIQVASIHGIRYEDYKVYAHKAKDHTNNSLHTAQLIGAIRVAAHVEGIQADCRMAANAKAFWTDEKLKMTGTYVEGMRHARDGMRHMLTMMCFTQ